MLNYNKRSPTELNKKELMENSNCFGFYYVFLIIMDHFLTVFIVLLLYINTKKAIHIITPLLYSILIIIFVSRENKTIDSIFLFDPVSYFIGTHT